MANTKKTSTITKSSRRRSTKKVSNSFAELRYLNRLASLANEENKTRLRRSIADDLGVKSYNSKLTKTKSATRRLTEVPFLALIDGQLCYLGNVKSYRYYLRTQVQQGIASNVRFGLADNDVACITMHLVSKNNQHHYNYPILTKIKRVKLSINDEQLNPFYHG